MTKGKEKPEKRNLLKLYHIVLIFLIISLPVAVVLHLRIQDLRAAAQEKAQLEAKLNHAVDHGILNLTNNQEGMLIFDKSAAIEHFFLTLYAAFGVLEDAWQQEKLQLYTPVIAVIVPDGFYFSYCELSVQEREGKKINRIWSELYPYPVYGEYGDTEKFVKCLEQVIGQHNQIAVQYGMNYRFFLPRMDTSEWQRAITGPAMLALFQGYPMTIGGNYNRTCISGAQIYHKKEFVIISEDNRRIFHITNCSKLDESKEIISNMRWLCNTMKECAELGANACPECLPEFVVSGIP